MINERLIEMRNRLDALKAESRAEIEKAEKIVNESKDILAKSTEAANVAFNKNDVTGYHKAREKCRAAEDAVEMCEEKIKVLKRTPLISEEDFNNGVEVVTAELDSVVSDAKAELLEMVEKMEAIKGSVIEAINYGNELLHDWQHDAFKDDACIVTSRGERLHHPSREMKYNNFDVQRFVNAVTERCSKWKGGK